MRWLMYQNDSAPSWVYNTIDLLAKEFGHILVKWQQGLVFGKDFDGVLAIPAPSYLLDNIASDNSDEDCKEAMDDDSDMRSTVICRGIYEGLKANHPHTYVIAYNTETDDEDDIHLFQGFSLDRDGFGNGSFTEWAKLRIDSYSIKRSKLTKAFAFLKKNPDYKYNFDVKVLGEDWWSGERRRMLLLNS